MIIISGDEMKKLILLISFATFLFSCSDDTESGKPVESMNAGDLTVYCENTAFEMMDSVFKMYEATFEKVNLKKELVNPRDAMKFLLAGEARVIIISRDYLKDEDSLMKQHDVAKHVRMNIAQDALVLFTNPGFPIDTMNATLMKNVLTNKDEKLSEHFTEIKSEPEFVTLDYKSSVYANILEVINKGEIIKRDITMFSSIDSLRQYVASNKDAVGIAYLSHVVNHPEFKMLRMGFTHSDGKREFPQVVHQSYLVMGRYPWPVMHYVYLLDERKNLPFWFATYLAKEAVTQKYFKDYGIVPAYAELKLVPQG